MRLILALALAFLPVGAADARTSDEEKARSIYEGLISFRTARGHGQVPKMADYIVKELKAGGISSEDIVLIPSGETVAMLVRVPAANKAPARPILFSAHMDVVDARAEDWKTDPFKLVEADGRFFGRGAADNKPGVTGLITTILRLQAEKFRGKRDLLFAFVGDEESGMATTKLIAAHPWVRGAELAINTDNGNGSLDGEGKPTMYVLQAAEKVYANFELSTKNRGGHSAFPRQDNAIVQLGEALGRIAAYRFPPMANDLTRAQLKATADFKTGEIRDALLAFSANPTDGVAAQRLGEDPTYNALIRTTCVTTLIQGGEVANALPMNARATVNCRIFPDDTVDNVLRTLTKIVADPGVTVTLAEKPDVGPPSSMRPAVKTALERVLAQLGRNVPIVPGTATGSSDGRIYRAAGIPTFGSSGLFVGEDTNQHAANERIATSAFYEAVQHIYLLAKELAR